jgi:hypothetical protein
LAQKQKGTPMEQNKRPRYESMQLHPLDFWQTHQKHNIEKRQTLLQMLLGKLERVGGKEGGGGRREKWPKHCMHL